VGAGGCVHAALGVEEQYRAFPKVSRSQLQPGDIVLFYSDLHHNGIYIGNGKMIHAPTTGDVVRIASITSAHALHGGGPPVLTSWPPPRVTGVRCGLIGSGSGCCVCRGCGWLVAGLAYLGCRFGHRAGRPAVR